ncbi:hypothetical protein [Sporisorium scitamineum]|uniref:Phosducin domain-containing protein n=1 Tax=Sporisorium scitamineum TaxID=49012 RepID=A0A0F7S7W7_9BASI|nr:hypothetical protein [Sporisorium scitamineum]
MSGSGDPIEAAILHGIDAQPASSYREDPNRGQEGATNTGPKGVLRDRQLRAQQDSAARTASIHATNRKMQSMALSSETYTEQVARLQREQAARLQRENLDSDDDDHDAVSQTAIADLQAKERRREMRIAELKSFHAARNSALISGQHASNKVQTSDRYFGHLREVDERGYVSSIDNEDPSVTIVIHIYSKAVAQCNALTASLASLARLYPHTKFLQVQAAAIGFGRSDDDDDEDEEEFDEYNSKTLQVLPTVLVYRAGKLVANLVRLDLDSLWRQGTEQDVRNLLLSHGALPSNDVAQSRGLSNTVTSDDDDD